MNENDKVNFGCEIILIFVLFCYCSFNFVVLFLVSIDWHPKLFHLAYSRHERDFLLFYLIFLFVCFLFYDFNSCLVVRLEVGYS